MVKAPTALSSRSSFTLVETLVTIVVLTFLILLIFSIVGSTVKISDTASRGADSSMEAKQVLDRIGADVEAMIARPDVDQFYFKLNGNTTATGTNDKMFFYSQQTGFFDSTVAAAGQGPYSLVGYRVNTNTAVNPAAPVLERLAQGLILDASSDKLSALAKIDPNNTSGPLTFLTFPARTSATTYLPATAGSITNQWGNDQSQTCPDVGSAAQNYDDGTSPFYDSIGNQTFRFEICFQRQDGTFSQYPGYTNSAPVYPASITNTVAIVVAIAILDAKSRKAVPANKWSTLIGALKDPTDANLTANPPVLMDSLWNTALKQSSFAAGAGIPATVATHIKVYQRYYYLNASKAQ